jgi:hypothetical protein
MAQYELLLTQNVAAEGIEFSEKYVKLTHKSILTGANADGGDPAVLSAAAGETDLGKVLKLIPDGAGSVKLAFAADDAGHTQNTDTGTTSQTFQLHSGESGGKLKAESATKFGLRNAADNAYNDIEAKDATFAKVTVAAAPSAGSDLVNKTYADGLLAANDAMIFKGTIGSGGTVESLPTTHGVGWTYKVITAATYAGKVCEVGDMLISLVSRAGSGNENTDWAVVQANIDGAVTGPASAISAENITIWNSNNRSVKDSGVLLSSLATTANLDSYVAKALFDANTVLFAVDDNTPAALAGIALPPKLWAAAPADKIGTGYSGTAIAGQIARDNNFLYICKTGGAAESQAWLRAPLATNW